MTTYDILGPLTDTRGLDQLESLWSELHRHHQQVASYSPLVADVAVSWRRRRRWYESLLADGGAYFTARTAGDKLVGYLLASVAQGEDDTFDVRGGIVEVVSLIVAKEARGTGIGRRLLGSAEEFAGRLGDDTLRIAVMAGNDAARSFYEALGFQPAEHVLLKHIEADDRPT